MRQTSPLFSPLKIGPMTIPNRFCRSATWEGLSNDETGFPTQKLFDMITEYSKGKTGLIIPGYVYPISHGKSIFKQNAMTTKKHAEVWKETIEKVHQNGSKIVFQICHGGDKCQEKDIHQQPIGCSGLIPGSRPMTDAEICDTIEAFAKAAKNLKDVGVDGIQIHCAHGFLINQFLSPALNKRTDKWGGKDENRTRILFEVIQAVRDATKDSIAVGIKINANDHVEGGIDEMMASQIISMVPPLDFVEFSGGVTRKAYGIRTLINEDTYRKNAKNPEEIIKLAHEVSDGVPYFEGYNLKGAEVAKSFFEDQIAIATVGGWRHFDKMEQAVKEGKTDIISLSRPFLKEPHLVEHLLNGADQVLCDSCSLCSLNRADGVKCQNWKK